MKIKKASKLNISPASLTFPFYSREHFSFLLWSILAAWIRRCAFWVQNKHLSNEWENRPHTESMHKTRTVYPVHGTVLTFAPCLLHVATAKPSHSPRSTGCSSCPDLKGVWEAGPSQVPALHSLPMCAMVLTQHGSKEMQSWWHVGGRQKFPVSLVS